MKVFRAVKKHPAEHPGDRQRDSRRMGGSPARRRQPGLRRQNSPGFQVQRRQRGAAIDDSTRRADWRVSEEREVKSVIPVEII
jgi:hypothetical protein